MSDLQKPINTSESPESFGSRHNRDRLLNLTNWSNALSWAFFVTGGAIAAGAIYFVIENYVLYDPSYFDVGLLIVALIILVISLICFLLGLFLQVLSEGILLALDIEENTRQLGRKNKR